MNSNLRVLIGMFLVIGTLGIFSCVKLDVGGEGQPCNSNRVCKQGLVCVNGTCRKETPTSDGDDDFWRDEELEDSQSDGDAIDSPDSTPELDGPDSPDLPNEQDVDDDVVDAQEPDIDEPDVPVDEPELDIDDDLIGPDGDLEVDEPEDVDLIEDYGPNCECFDTNSCCDGCHPINGPCCDLGSPITDVCCDEGTPIRSTCCYNGETPRRLFSTSGYSDRDVMAVCEASSMIAINTGPATVTLYRYTGEVITALTFDDPSSYDGIFALAFSEDCKYLGVGFGNNKLGIIDVNDSTNQFVITTGGEENAIVAFVRSVPDTSYGFATVSNSGGIEIWTKRGSNFDWTKAKSIGIYGSVSALDVSKDYVAFGNGTGEVYVWKWNQTNPERVLYYKFEAATVITDIAFIQSNKVIASISSGIAKVWDVSVQNPSPEYTFNLNIWGTDVFFDVATGNGIKYLLISAAPDVIKVYETESYVNVMTYNASNGDSFPSGQAFDAFLIDDAQYILIPYYRDYAYVWCSISLTAQ